MAAELMSLTETAREFLAKSGYLFVQLQSANLDPANNQWTLVFDVGFNTVNLKKVVIDGATGKVVALG